MGFIFQYEGPSEVLKRRQLLTHDVADFHSLALGGLRLPKTKENWVIRIAENCIFDAAGLKLLAQALCDYQGAASDVVFELAPGPEAWRDYYSLQAPQDVREQRLVLAITATRATGGGRDCLVVGLPERQYPVAFPDSFLKKQQVALPGALLLSYHCPHDMLLANWIAFGIQLEARVRISPWAWLKGCMRSGRGFSIQQRMALAYTSIDPSAYVHPTAVVEGSIIGPNTRIGAHAVIRFSVIGANVRIHDGAKVELSTIGDKTWLMHDLVLYRSVAESSVFLIHGPYQFSYFQHSSSAFATIMMDWRPDERAIRVMTPSGLRSYGGSLLGAVLEEGAKTLGGSLLAPGRVVPSNAWLGPLPSTIHSPRGGALETGRALTPEESAQTNQDL